MQRIAINRNTLFYGLGMLLMKGISFIMLPIYTNYLSTYEYGQLEIIVTFTNLASLMLGLGLIEGLYRFASGMPPEKQRIVLSNVIQLSVLTSLLVVGLLLLFSKHLSQVLPGELPVAYIQWVALNLSLGGVKNILLTWLRMKERAGEFFVVSVSMAGLQALLSFLLLLTGEGVMSIIISGVIATTLVIIFLFWRNYQQLIWVPAIDTYKTLLKYGWPFIISGFSGFALSGADRWILAETFQLEELATYAIAAKFAFLPVVLLQPYSLWWYPKRFALLGSGEKLEKNARYAVLGSVYAVFLCGLIGFIAPLVIRYTTPVDYHESVIYLPWLLAAIAMKLVSEFLNIGCFIGHKTYQQMGIDISISILGLCLMLTLNSFYGIWGIIIALNAAYLLRMLLFFVLSQRQLHLPYRLTPLVSMSLISGMFLVLGQRLF